MRGRPGCPTGQEKHSVGATGGSPPFLHLQGKVGYRIAPSSAPVCALGHLPPKGKALGVGRTLLVCKTTPPSPPSWGAGRYGHWFMGRRPGKKEGGPPQGPPNQSRESRGENLSPLALFLPISREKWGPPPGRRGPRGAAPRGTVTAPTTRRVRSTASVPAGTHVAGSNLRWSRRDHLPPPRAESLVISPGRDRTSGTPSPAPPRGWGGPAPAAGRRSAGGTPPRRRRPPGASGRRGRGS